MNIVLINYRDSIHVVLRMRILYKRTRVNCFYTFVFSCKNFNSCTTSVMMAGSSSRLELLPLEGSGSAVWNHFGFPSRNEVHRKICSKVLKYNGSTTNLRFHLKEYHKSVYASLPTTSDSLKKQSVPVNQATLPQTYVR